MVLLNEMAVAWSLYLSLGVILIFSNGAFSSQVQQQQQQPATEKNLTNSFQIGGRNVSTSTGCTSLPPMPSHPISSAGTSPASENFSPSQNEITVDATLPAKARIAPNGHQPTASRSPFKERPTGNALFEPLFRTSTAPTSHFENAKTTARSTFPKARTRAAKFTVTQTEPSATESSMTLLSNVTSNHSGFTPTLTRTRLGANTTSTAGNTRPSGHSDWYQLISTPSAATTDSDIESDSLSIFARELEDSESTDGRSSTLVTVSPRVTSTPDTDRIDRSLSPDYMADAEADGDFGLESSHNSTETPSNDSTAVDIPSLRKKFIHTLTNFTASDTNNDGVHTTPSLAENATTGDGAAAATISNLTSYHPTDASSPPTPTASTFHPTPTPQFANVTAAAAAANDTPSLNKEHLQFPGITLKVSHVLIPKQKRSRYNIQNMRIELPKTEMLRRSPPSVPKTSKNSNCTRFPVQVVAAADAESKEKVNLTEEHYDCEFSSEIQSSQQKEPVDSIHTYYGGYVFRYTIPKVSANGSANGTQLSTESTRSTETTTAEDNDDYYSSYIEYADTVNGSNSSSAIDDGVFPDPIIRDEKMPDTKPEAYSVPVPETSLMDSDLHDHDVIDSVMYIYFGGASHGQRGAGRQIIIVGAVIALVAQFLTLASSIRRIKTHKGEQPTIILLNVETALTLTNLIFILGVQSTSNHTLCKVTAVSLYYLHLATLIWFLLSSVYSVQIVCQIKPPCTFFMLCVCGWVVPLFTTLLSYAFNERSFETSLYCWVSPLKGILFSFILPVILLCIICIVLTVYGLKRATEPTDDADDTYSHRKLLRISAVALPLFSVIWFTGMVALENSTSLLFSLIFLLSDTVLNWLLFACWLPSEASQWKDMDEDYYDEEEDFDDEPVLVKRRFDDQPLLSELYEYGAQGQLYNLKVEPISIISTP